MSNKSGICVQCGKPWDGKQVMCDACRKKQADQRRVRKEKWLSSGLCGRCGKNPVIEGTKYCIECASKAKKYKDSQATKEKRRQKYHDVYKDIRRERRIENKNSGLCALCGSHPATKGVLCRSCYQKKKAWYRNFYSEDKRQELREIRKFRDEQGLCVVCGKKPQSNGKLCEQCYESHRNAVNKRELKLLAIELCDGNCMECKLPDCYGDDIRPLTKEEKKYSKMLDKKATSYLYNQEHLKEMRSARYAYRNACKTIAKYEEIMKERPLRTEGHSYETELWRYERALRNRDKYYQIIQDGGNKDE